MKNELPVACTLMPAELSYCFPPDKEWISKLAKLIEMEHQCCPFLRFRVTVEPGNGPIWFELTGPEGTKEFLADVFNLAE